ncbi:hypothetical protein [Vandammella animalimorsus]|nr:hypothetical protein [Vandammella animalimorsus]
MAQLYRPHQEPSCYAIALRPGVAAGMRVWAGPGQGEAVAWHACPPASDMDAQAAQQRVQRLVAARAREGFAEQGAAGSAALDPLAQLAQALPSWQADPALAQALRQRLHPDVWRTLTPRQRSRLVWRIGEVRLTGVAGQLLAYAGSGDAMLDYCLAWALCRCTAEHDAQADAVRAQLQRWARQAPDAALQYLAGVAWLALSSDAERERHAQALMADWPVRLREASAAATPASFAAALAEGALDGGPDGGLLWQRLPHGQWLEQLDQVAQSPAHRHWARPLLLQQLQTLPLEYGSFRSLRRLYKAAQLRLDAQLLGLLNWRFETTPHKPPPDPDAARPPARPAQGHAWGRRTRQYFLRRNWRTLRRLGQLGSPHYVLLATAALLAYDEQPPQAGSGWALLEHITGQAAQQPAAAGGAGQGVPYAALWAQCPQAVPLLLHARNPAVAALAVRLMQQQSALQASLPPDAWLQLLDSRHACVAEYALHQVRRLLDAGRGDAQQHRRWLAQLARAALPEAQALVLQTLSQDPRRHGRDPELLLALLLAPQPPMRQMARLLLDNAAHEPGVARACVQALQHWLEDAEPWSAAWQDVEPDVLWALQQPLRHAATTQAYAPLLPLLEHHVPQAVCWAAAWLAQHPGFAAQPPMAALQRLLDSRDEPLHQRAAAQLFAALPPRLQQQQPALLLAFAASAHAPVRAVAHSAIAELARQRPSDFDALAQALVQGLLDGLFRSEPALGLHADLLALLQGPLQQAAQALDAATVLRLLLAKSQGAQQLGLWLLPGQPCNAWAVGEWAALARSPLQAARQWAIEAYRSQPEQVQAHLDDALRIFDSRWDDALDFACGYFQQPAFVQAALWPRPRLIGLCDHSQPQAQQCGRTLLAQLVPMPELLHYLLQLSQHPSAAMQQLVADWLEQGALKGAVDADAAEGADAANQTLARLQQLRPYFVQVLSQVNRARQLKARVQRFLLAQALQSPEAAAFVSGLYERLVVGMAVGDREHYLHSLLTIQARYPQVATPLHILATPLWSKGATAQQGALP